MGTNDSFYVTGGTLKPDAPSYVERRADKDLLEGLLRGEFCYVLTSRQMGKSSLMVRTATKLLQQKVNVVVLDLTAIGQNLNPDQWYDGLMAVLGRQLDLESLLEPYWFAHGRLSPVQRFFQCVRDVVLPRRPGPLVIFIDEIDTVRSLPFPADEFFAAIRECHNRRSVEADWGRVTFCLLGVATPSDLVQDVRLTPFNIGRRIELNDFTEEEAAPLAAGLVRWNQGGEVVRRQEMRRAHRLLRRVLYWTHGHPYLTQRLCRAVAEPSKNPAAAGGPNGVRRWSRRSAHQTVDAMCRELFLTAQARGRDDNLLFVRDRLLRSGAEVAELLSLYRKALWAGRRVRDDGTGPLTSVLLLSGVVQVRRGRLVLRNRIYRRAFDRCWVQEQLPDAERRRQRDAFIRGLAGATAVSMLVIGVMAGLVIYAARSNRDLQGMTYAALRASARASLLSGQAGQRFDALHALGKARAIQATDDLLPLAIACLAVPDLREGRRWEVPQGAVGAIGLSRDFSNLAWSDAQGTVRIRRPGQPDPETQLPERGKVPVALRFSPDGHRLIVVRPAGDTASVCGVWEWAAGTKRLELRDAASAWAVDFSGDSRLVAVGRRDGTVEVVSWDQPELKTSFPLGESCAGVRFHPELGWLAAWGEAGSAIEIWEVEASGASSLQLFKLHTPTPVTMLAWHPVQGLLAGACADGRIRLWEPGGGTHLPIQQWQAVGGKVLEVAFNRPGQLLASSGEDGALRLWSVGRGEVQVVRPGVHDVPQLQFHAEESQLSLWRTSDEVGVWEVKGEVECQVFFQPQDQNIRVIDVDPRGRYMVAAHAQGLTFWDLSLGARLGEVELEAAYDAVFDPGGQNLWVSQFQGSYLYSVQTRQARREEEVEIAPRQKLTVDPGSRAFCLSRDGHTLAVLLQGKVRILHPPDLVVSQPVAGLSEVSAIALSADGRWLAAATGGEVRLQDLRSQGATSVIPAPGVVHLQFSPDAVWLAVGTAEACQMWRVSGDRRENWTLRRGGGGGGATPVAFSADGALMAYAYDSTVVRLQDMVRTNQTYDLPIPGKEPIVALRFTPTGSKLVCARRQGGIVVWDLEAAGQELAREGWAAWRPHSAAPPPAPAGRKRGQLIWKQVPKEWDPVPLSVRDERQDNNTLLMPELFPDRVDYRRNRADFHKRKRHFAEAIVDFREWIRLEPGNAWPWRDLAWLYLFAPPELRNYPEAKSMAQQAVDLEPSNADNHYRLGVACYQTGDYATALVHLEEAFRLRGKEEDVLIQAFQAKCLEKLSRSEQAMESRQRALRAYEGTDDKYRERHALELAEAGFEPGRTANP